jgi:hypothetical protein
LADEKADITAFACDRLSDGSIPVFVPLYNGRGFLAGWLVQSNQQIVASTLAWHKDAGVSALFFNEGLNQWVTVQGGLFTTTTSLAAWGSAELEVDDQAVSGASVSYSTATLSKGILSIPVNDGAGNFTPFKLTSSTGAVTVHGSGLSGNGLLIPDTAPEPGIYGWMTNSIRGVGVVHPVSVKPGNATEN